MKLGTFRKEKYLLEHEDILKGLLSKNEIVLFLDYDGTLASIAETPEQAVMTQEMRKVLTSLLKHPKCHIAVISGRMLSDLKQMVDLPQITYVGNHGYEIEMQHDLNFKGFITTQYKEALFNIKKSLNALLSPIKGVWIEDKGIILAVHYRSATERSAAIVKKYFFKVCQNYLKDQYIGLMEGKKVLEVRPPIKWDKGEAALWILSKWQKEYGKDQITAMYVGDDVTDEDAFKMLDGIALTVKVGFPKRSFAKYYLKDQTEVLILLKQMLAIKN